MLLLSSLFVQVKETIPSLADLGGHQLYPDLSVGGQSIHVLSSALALLETIRSASCTALHFASLFVTYSSLTGAILSPPSPLHSQVPPEWHRHVEWITILVQNLTATANGFRPVQVRRPRTW